MNTPFRPQFSLSLTQNPVAFNPFSASNALPPELHLYTLSESERAVFINYFSQLDPFSSGKLENSAVLEFLQTCGLQNSVLLQIFSYFDSADNGLSEAQFYAILRLVAHAQTGQEISRDLVYIQAAPPRFGSDPVDAYLNSKRRSQLPRSSYSSTSYSSMQANFVSVNGDPGNKDKFGTNISNPQELKPSNNWWDVATDDLYLLTSVPHHSRLSRSATISTSNPFNTLSPNAPPKSPIGLQNVATPNRAFTPSTDLKRFSTGLIKQKGFTRLSLPFGQSISQNTSQSLTLPQSQSSSLSQSASSRNMEIPSTLSSPTPRTQRPKFDRTSLELGDFQRMMMMSPNTSPVSPFGNPFTALRQLEELNTPSSFSQSINSASLSGPNSPQESVGAASLTMSYFSPEFSANTAHKSPYTELGQADYSTLLVNKRPNHKGQLAPPVPPQRTKPISLKYSLRPKSVRHTEMDKMSSSTLNTPNSRVKSLDQELEDLQRDLANLRAVSVGLRNES